MANFVKHEACVTCGSRDNVGVYDDGSKFCFGCHWFLIPDAGDRLRRWAAKNEFMLAEPIDRFGNDVVELPPDFNLTIPIEPYRWISKYLNAMELLEHSVGWSEKEQKTIFPIYGKSSVPILWTGRSLEGKRPKWYIQGRKSDIFPYIIESNPASDKVVVVEDIVSAIKVARVVNSIPLFGTNFPLEHARKLSERFSHVCIWLDSDAKATALKMALKLSHWFTKVQVIYSDDDPKVYGTAEISNFIKA